MSGFIAVLSLATPAPAQPTAPCRPGDNLVSLGKAAFYRAIERGAFAIGERTLEDLTDGLGGASVAKAASSTRRVHATAPAQARAAVFPPASNAALVTALTAYVDGPSSEAADAAFQSFLVGATKILFETPAVAREPARVGLVLEGGQLFNQNSTFAVPDMTNESRRLKLEDSLFGDADLGMGKSNKVLAASPFFKAPVVADTRNVDRNNIGLAVKKEQDLRALWFEDYRAHLAALAKAPAPAQVTEALGAGWPILQKFWAFKRTEVFVDRALTAFGTELREVSDRVTRENLPRQDCEAKAR